MKKITKLICVLLMMSLMVGSGIYYVLFAPRQASFDETENRKLTASPKFSIQNLLDGTLSSQLESWMLDRFWGRAAAMDISMAIKDSGSIATYRDALAVMGNKEDTLAGQEQDEGKMDDLIDDLFTTPAATTPPATTPPVTTPSHAGPEHTTPAVTTPAPTTPQATLSTNVEDYPEKPAIISSADGKVTRHKSYQRRYVLAISSVIGRVADTLPEGGKLVFTMVPQSNVANSYISAKNKEYFTSEAEIIVQAFTPDNVIAISSANVLDEYMKRGEYVYFRSDMHWTPQGTYAVYQEMVAAAGQTPTPWSEFNIATEENFLGTYYRDNPASYLKDNPDTLTLVTPKFPLEWRRITGKDQYKVIPFMNMDARKNDRYTIYLGGSAGPWTYAESENGKTENCLVICDSFGLAFVPMVSTNYQQTHYLDPRFFDERVVGYSLQEMIENYNIKDVYVIVGDLHSYGSEFFTKYLYEQIGG